MVCTPLPLDVTYLWLTQVSEVCVGVALWLVGGRKLLGTALWFATFPFFLPDNQWLGRCADFISLGPRVRTQGAKPQGTCDKHVVWARNKSLVFKATVIWRLSVLAAWPSPVQLMHCWSLTLFCIIFLGWIPRHGITWVYESLTLRSSLLSKIYQFSSLLAVWNIKYITPLLVLTIVNF